MLVLMQPQQPYVSPPPVTPHQTPYDFFLNPAPQKRTLSLGGGSWWQRLLLIGGGIVALVLIIVITTSLLRGSDKAIPSLISVAQDQSQIANISSQATTNASSEAAKNLAASATLSAQSAQQNLLVYLQKNGRKVSAKELALKQSPTVDATLKDAVAASNFDAVYLQTMQTQLQTYERDLTTAFNNTKGAKGRELLRQQYKSAQLLTAQTKAAQTQ